MGSAQGGGTPGKDPGEQDREQEGLADLGLGSLPGGLPGAWGQGAHAGQPWWGSRKTQKEGRCGPGMRGASGGQELVTAASEGQSLRATRVRRGMEGMQRGPKQVSGLGGGPCGMPPTRGHSPDRWGHLRAISRGPLPRQIFSPVKWAHQPALAEECFRGSPRAGQYRG